MPLSKASQGENMTQPLVGKQILSPVEDEQVFRSLVRLVVFLIGSDNGTGG